jgi:hypothetical protein
VRAKFGFALAGYVVMPEHGHLLMGEPKLGNPSMGSQSLKLRASKTMRRLRHGTRAFQKWFAFRELALESRFPAVTLLVSQESRRAPSRELIVGVVDCAAGRR